MSTVFRALYQISPVSDRRDESDEISALIEFMLFNDPKYHSEVLQTPSMIPSQILKELLYMTVSRAASKKSTQLVISL